MHLPQVSIQKNMAEETEENSGTQPARKNILKYFYSLRC